MNEAPAKRTGSSLPNLWRRLGPGLVTGAADDDPSGIATHSQIGAQFGFQLSWTFLFSFPLMVVIQEVAAEIGSVTGRGIAHNLRRHYSPWLLRGVVALLLIANIINLGAERVLVESRADIETSAQAAEALRPIAGSASASVGALLVGGGSTRRPPSASADAPSAQFPTVQRTFGLFKGEQPVNALLGLGYSLFLPECQGTQSRSGKKGQVRARGIDAHTPLGPLPVRHNVISAISAGFRCHLSGPR